MSTPTQTLNTGAAIPALGLGVWQATDGQEVTAVTHALTHGYDYIDTAAIYQNEAGVGEGVRKSGIAREELFLTTKMWLTDIRAGRGEQALQTSLKKLQLDYVDLYLLHWPVDGGLKAYRAMERLRERGLTRAIGLSNYMPEHLEDLRAKTTVTPAVNQVELHPYHQAQDVQDYCREAGIVVTAWSPLMQGKFLDEPLFGTLGAPYGKTAAQVLLRWFVQKGINVIPKSVTPSRIEENHDVFDFELSDGDMAEIDGLDRGEEGRMGPDPRNFDF